MGQSISCVQSGSGTLSSPRILKALKGNPQLLVKCGFLQDRTVWHSLAQQV